MNGKLRCFAAAALSATLILTVGTAAFANEAAEQTHPGLEAPEVEPATTQELLAFDYPIEMSDAAEFGEKHSDSVLGYRFENSDILGEYYVSSGQTVEEFLIEFESTFGTQPEVTSLIVEVPTPSASQRLELAPDSQVLISGAEPFDAPAISAAPAMDNMSASTRDESTSRLAVATDWRPNDAEFEIKNINSRANFLHSYWWHSGSTPQMMPLGWGAEFEVNLYNDASQSNHRPNCLAGYKDAFWAKNYSYNWSIMRPDYQAANLASLGAYADYNDLSDECNRNSISIGVRYPRNIAYVNSSYGLMIWVSAPRGTKGTSRVGGVVQATWDGYCTSTAGSLLALTDCMGVYAGSWPMTSDAYRLTANYGNGWIAPTKCWTSGGKGLDPAVTQTPC